MLHTFLAANQASLIERCKTTVAQRSPSSVGGVDLEHGIPLFLTQLIQTLQLEQAPAAPIASLRMSGPSDGTPALSQIGETAGQHGRELLQHGFTVDQVVHVYGDLCQAITDLASEKGVELQTGEFRTLNRCLDNAIAGAVTEYSYQQVAATAELATQALAERLGFLAHELRNLVQTAKLALMAIKGGSVGLTGATGAVLDRSLIGLGNLIDRSLAEVRVSAGVSRQLRLISLAGFTEKVRIAAALEAEVRGCRLTVSPVDPKLAIDADQDLLLAAVGNLLQNAFKFTAKHTEVTLHVYAVGDRILIEVGDRCGGLPPGPTENLFLPFTQAIGDRTGAGLGLSIARQGVEANNGTLRVRDVPGSGCVFTIDLPRRLLRPPRAGSRRSGDGRRREARARAATTGRRARILIVEDSDDTRSALGDVLKREGYEVEVCEEGAQALVLQGKSPFDVLITDLFMPGMDGVETIREFRRIYPQTRIIAMSGDARMRVDYLSLSLELGADKVLRKPFDLGAVREALKQVLGPERRHPEEPIPESV